jgi:hypothetical protein
LHYKLQNGILYRRSLLGLLLGCVDKDESDYVVREVHLGICGIHAGPRAMVAKLMNIIYYYLGMHKAEVK